MPIVFTDLGYADGGYADGPYASPGAIAAMGLQFQSVKIFAMGLQFRAVIYNTNLLRILRDFPNRGQVGSGGNNAWGYAKGLGLTWIASSTQPGDFDVNNLNTDIEEQIWRSATGTVSGITLRCDTEIEQGIFNDTFSILNHNLTSSAVVTLEGSVADPSFSTIGISIPLQVTPDRIYWISPELPLTGYRYWRISISDATNPNGFVSMGICAFGPAEIFVQEQNTDSMDFDFQDFAAKVATEGFTNAAVSRALKRFLHLDFKSVDRQMNNFTILRTMKTRFRTTHRCLWIPTPDKTDMRITGEFAVFAKISGGQKERHNYKGPRNQYVDMAFDLDEST